MSTPIREPRNFSIRLRRFAQELGLTATLGVLAAVILLFVSNRSPDSTPQSDAIAVVNSGRPAVVPKKSKNSPPSEQRISIRARIDGRDELRVNHAKAKWIHRDSLWPSNVQINGIEWAPQKTPELANADESHFLNVDADFSKATLEIVRGRGSVTFHKLADAISVRFDDPQPGRDTYEIVLHIPAAGAR